MFSTFVKFFELWFVLRQDVLELEIQIAFGDSPEFLGLVQADSSLLNRVILRMTLSAGYFYR